MNNKRTLLGFLFIVLVLFIGIMFFVSNKNKIISQASADDEENIISICSIQDGDNCTYSNTRIISMSSNQEPSVQITSNNKSGNATISLYKIDGTENFLNALLYNNENKLTEKFPDTNNFYKITSFQKNINKGSDNGNIINLPLDETGTWYLEVAFNDKKHSTFITRGNIGTMVKEGNNEMIFWGQKFSDFKSINDGDIEIYNLENNVNFIKKISFNKEGIAKTEVDPRSDIAIITSSSGKAFLPINYSLYEGNYNVFDVMDVDNIYYTYTDRAIYDSGSKVNFKLISRSDSGQEYLIPSGNIKLEIKNNNNEVIYNNTYTFSQYGTISGDFDLPQNIKTGQYNIYVNDGLSEYSRWQGNFEVKYYRKPEYYLEVGMNTDEIINKKSADIQFGGNYYFGAPLSNKEIDYKIYSDDFHTLSNYESNKQSVKNFLENKYGSYFSDSSDDLIKKGKIKLDENGKYSLSFPFDLNKDESQIVTIEAEYSDISGNKVKTSKNILVYSGGYNIYKQSDEYILKKDEKNTLNYELYKNIEKDEEKFDEDLVFTIKRTDWKKDGKDESYQKTEENVDTISKKSDINRKVSIDFTPIKSGSYEIVVEGKDKSGNLIKNNFFYYVYDNDFQHNNKENLISIQANKEKYDAKDNAEIFISSKKPDIDVFTYTERKGLYDYQIISLNGNNGKVNFQIVENYMPNIVVGANSFTDDMLSESTKTIDVSTESQKLNIDIKTDKEKYGPKENVQLNIETSNFENIPVPANISLSVIDKSLYELADAPYYNKIFETFWGDRYGHTPTTNSLKDIRDSGGMGGCFSENTEILMASGSTKKIKDIKEGDQILTRKNSFDNKLVSAKVSGTHQRKVNNYLIVNNNLKITTNHYIWANNGWKQAGDLEIGDELLDTKGNIVKVESIVLIDQELEVYNLEIEDVHSFFADFLWVHNDKSGVRENFADSAYWNPSIDTDSNGIATINFQLPDNLTTWRASSIGITKNNMFGEGVKDILVSKDIIVRPILPNILRNTDKIKISTIVMNNTPNDEIFNVDFEFTGGNTINEKNKDNIEIPANDSKTLYWEIEPKDERIDGKIKVTAKAIDNEYLNDSVEMSIPIYEFGFEKDESKAGINNQTYDINLDEKIDDEKSNIKLSLTPNITGTFTGVFDYLISYPFGCVEQITSKLAPSIVAKKNPDLFENIDSQKINQYINKSINDLIYAQNTDGSWGWYIDDNKNMFLTTYVIENLIDAKNLGYAVDDNSFEQAKKLLNNEYKKIDGDKKIQYSNEENIARLYALNLLEIHKETIDLNKLASVSPPFIAMGSIVNKNAGIEEADKNGLDLLISKAHVSEDALYWDEAEKEYYGSRDASTAIALRAMILLNAKEDNIIKAIKYLSINKNKNYWANTFGSSQALKAISSYNDTSQKQNTNYSYIINLGNEEIANGKVNSIDQKIDDVNIPIEKISKNTQLSINIEGEGNLFSTLDINQFITDDESKAFDTGLSIDKKYINAETGKEKFGVGDIVKVALQVDNNYEDLDYVVIKDSLPSGLVPININLDNQKNEKFDNYGENFSDYSFISNITTTTDGVKIAISKMGKGNHIYYYYATTINDGIFYTPPAEIISMYTPDIYGYSNVKIVNIPYDEENHVKNIKNNNYNYLGLTIIIILSTIIGYYLVKKRQTTKFK